MPDVFDKAMEATFLHEGGYANDPNDRGGATKYGISQRSYPDLDIPNLAMEEAREIYRRDFWDRVRCSEIEYAPLAAKVFDAAVNMGPGAAVLCVQRAVNRMGAELVEDGAIGPKTIQAVNFEDDGGLVLTMFVGELVRKYLAISKRRGQAGFLDTWLNRAVHVPLEVVG